MQCHGHWLMRRGLTRRWPGTLGQRLDRQWAAWCLCGVLARPPQGIPPVFVGCVGGAVAEELHFLAKFCGYVRSAPPAGCLCAAHTQPGRLS